MSTDQPTLQETEAFKDARSQRRQEIILAEGGIYGRSEAEYEPDQPERVCLHCGRSIPADVARVVGDENGNVPCCDSCRVGNGNETYTRITKAVRCYRAGAGKWADGGGE